MKNIYKRYLLLLITPLLLFSQEVQCKNPFKYSQLSGVALKESLDFQKSVQMSTPSVKKIVEDIFRAEQGFAEEEDVSHYINREFYKEAVSSFLFGFLTVQMFYLQQENDSNKKEHIEKGASISKYAYREVLNLYGDKILQHDSDWCRPSEYIVEALDHKIEELEINSNTKRFIQKADIVTLPLFIEAVVVVKDLSGSVYDTQSRIFAIPKVSKLRELAKDSGLAEYEQDMAIISFISDFNDINKIDNQDFNITLLKNQKYSLFYKSREFNIAARMEIDLTSETSSTYSTSFVSMGRKYFLEAEMREVFVKDGIFN